MEALIAAARAAGLWKLVSRVFVENTASRALLARVGFREVGVYEKHARLDGVWRDVVIVERLIPENQTDDDRASMTRTLPTWISRVAIAVGVALFARHAAGRSTVRPRWLRRVSSVLFCRLSSCRAPVGTCFARSGGTCVFRSTVRPTFWRLFRVRLAADAVSYFTVRGLASEPLRVVLLLDRVPGSGVDGRDHPRAHGHGRHERHAGRSCAIVAMTSDVLPEDWQRIFRYIAVGAVVVDRRDGGVF